MKSPEMSDLSDLSKKTRDSGVFALCSRFFELFGPSTLVLLFAACPQPKPAVPAGQFAQLGARKLATVAVNCGEMTDFVFSPTGQRVIYAGWISDSRNPRAGVWVGESLLAQADSVFEIGFTESNEPYFVGLDSGRAFLYYRHARPRAYERITAPTFSRDGNVVAYLATDAGRQSLLTANGATRTIRGVLDYALSPTGERLAYATRDSEDWFVVENGDTSDIYDWVQNMTYSPDGHSLIYVALADDEWFVVVNGAELDHYDSDVAEISAVAMSDDGNHLAYVINEYDEEADETFAYAMVDDEESDVYLDISDPRFSPKGDNFAFVADDGDGQFVVTRAGEDTPYDAVWGLVFSPDGQHVAYAASADGQEMIILDGTQVQAYDQVDKLKFNPDGKRYGYGALDGDDFVWVVDEVK